jgi:Na+-translocating ferredoxin:NAD+ oxidoreductase RnfG subunit
MRSFLKATTILAVVAATTTGLLTALTTMTETALAQAGGSGNESLALLALPLQYYLVS